MMRFPVMLEQTETGFAVQAPDLAISTSGETIEAAKRAAAEAIRINLDAYRETGQPVPEARSVSSHLENIEFRDLLFAYVDVAGHPELIAAQPRASSECDAAPLRAPSDPTTTPDPTGLEWRWESFGRNQVGE